MVTHQDFNAEIIVESTVARTLLSKDTTKFIRTSNGSATTLTVAPDATGNWGDAAEITVMQGGAGQVTIAAGAGVTLRSNETLKTLEQYAVIGLKRIAANEWVVSGNREAAV